MQTSTITQTANAHAFILSQVSSEEIITALPYAEAVALARSIIANSSQPELKFMVGGDLYEMFEFEGHYEVRVTYRNPTSESSAKTYGTFLGALAELQREYHEAVGWHEGLNALFVPENDHQANGQRAHQEYEIRICADMNINF